MLLNFFDKVFLINLDSRPDRLEISDYHLKEQGIDYERFPAVKDDNGIKGLILSMRALFKDCLDKGYNNVLVLEDDAEMLFPAVPFLREILPQLPKDYHCFHLGLNLLTQPKRITSNILRINTSYATHAVAYSRQGMEFIYTLLMREEIVPYDILLMKEVQPSQKCYATFPMLCTQRTNYSDIEKKETNWHSLMAMTYAMHTKLLQSMNEVAYCNNGHLINWVAIQIDPTKMEVQHPELIGKVCDCGRFKYDEEICGCPGTKEWRVTWKENTNYAS